MSEIGKRLRRLRKERGLSQRELAEKAGGRGVSYAYLSRIEGGAREPSVKALRKLAAALGVSAVYLETGLPDVVYVLLRNHGGETEELTAFRSEREAEDWAALLNESAGGGIGLRFETVCVPIDDPALEEELAREYLSEPLEWRPSWEASDLAAAGCLTRGSRPAPREQGRLE